MKYISRIFEVVHTSLWKIKLTLLETRRRIVFGKKLKESAQFQGKYGKEKRCFVIGNGPSLREEDLELLEKNGIITFAANRIFKLFPDTTWRPTFYGACDTKLFSKSKDDIDKISCNKFIPLDIYEKYVDKKDNYYVFSRIPCTFFNRLPHFSCKMTSRFGEGGTITYHLLQLAVSMGFKEIYLIGVDFSFSFGIGPDGKYFEDKSIKNNHLKQDTIPVDTMPNLYNNLRAYMKAEQYTKKHGIRIYNATRGGKLEVFERVSFDSLF